MGQNIEHVFVLAAKLKDKYGKDFERIPTGTIGMVTYFDRLNAGLQQFMAGARKFALKYVSRNDLCALTRKAAEISGIPYVMEDDLCSLTREASELSGIPYVMEADRDEVDKILC